MTLASIPTTTSRTLEGLRDPRAHETWRRFDRNYRLLLINLARRAGLSASDAADVVQETLFQFARDYQRSDAYDRSRGRLRSWLIGIAHHRIVDVQRRRTRRREHRGESAIGVLTDRNDLERIWDEERDTIVLDRAMSELRQSRASALNMRILELMIYHGLSAGDIAGELGVPIDDVYTARSRMVRRLQTIVCRIEGEIDGTQRETSSAA